MVVSMGWLTLTVVVPLAIIGLTAGFRPTSRRRVFAGLHRINRDR